jgi:hypothetical protein
MRFEEALAQMRLGKKITHESLGDNVYLQACYMSIMGERIGGMSIVKMHGDKQHLDMGAGGGIDDMVYPGTLIIKESVLNEINNTCKHGNFPQLNLFIIMSEDWAIFE